MRNKKQGISLEKVIIGFLNSMIEAEKSANSQAGEEHCELAKNMQLLFPQSCYSICSFEIEMKFAFLAEDVSETDLSPKQVLELSVGVTTAELERATEKQLRKLTMSFGQCLDEDSNRGSLVWRVQKWSSERNPRMQETMNQKTG